MGETELEGETREGPSPARLLGTASSKLRNAFRMPEKVPWHLYEHLHATGRALAYGGVREAAYCLPELIEAGTYGPYLRRSTDGGLLRRPVQGFEMWLPVDDTGLSRRLIRHGLHEPKSTEVYGQLLSRLAERVDDVTVFEVGTNIGYFPLLALEALPADARMYAVEPNPVSLGLLERNLELNSCRDRVDVTELALSDRDGTAQFHLSEATNWSQLGAPPDRYTGESIEVRVSTGDSFLRERAVDPERINVLRMDVQGHELHVLRGLSDVLDGDTPLLLFVEIHEELADEGKLEEFVDLLERNGMFLERGFSEPPYGRAIPLDDFEEVRAFPFEATNCLELFVRNEW